MFDHPSEPSTKGVDRTSGHWPWVVIGTLAGLALLAGLIWAIWKLPPLLYGDVTKASSDARIQAASSFRTALVAGLAGLAALAGLFFTNRTYRLSQQGQLADRYSRAIGQLGTSDQLDVRLGGIYALERLAVDSERDQPTVVEVLSAFIREHGQPAAQPRPGTSGNAGDEPTKPPRPVPASDVQAAVTVLGRLPRRKNVSRADLGATRLEGANLSGAPLEGADLYGAHLEAADLSGAHLEAANIRCPHLRKARLNSACLEGAKLDGADLTEALLYYAQPQGAFLAYAKGLTQQNSDWRLSIKPSCRMEYGLPGIVIAKQ